SDRRAADALPAREGVFAPRRQSFHASALANSPLLNNFQRTAAGVCAIMKPRLPGEGRYHGYGGMRVFARLRMKIIKRFLALALTLALLLSCAAAQELAAGAKGGEVERLQQRLYYLGFLSIQPDGDYGPKTVEAVTDFQTFFRARGYGLRGDGVADADTQALLFDDAVADADYPLKQGDSNGYVRRAQRRLIELGYLAGAADGDYGQNTADAVRAFQQMLIDNGVSGVTADGA